MTQVIMYSTASYQVYEFARYISVSAGRYIRPHALEYITHTLHTPFLAFAHPTQTLSSPSHTLHTPRPRLRTPYTHLVLAFAHPTHTLSSRSHTLHTPCPRLYK